jgi:uncharacterized protein YbjT (DUF2867 family)
LEQALSGQGFESLTFVRPGLIGGHRDEFRLGERMMVMGLTLTAPLLPKQWRLNPAPQIAGALLEAAIRAKTGVHVVSSDQMI